MNEQAKTENIIVTGASRGLGEKLAFRLAESGHQVFAIARNREKLQDLVTTSGTGRIHRQEYIYHPQY